MPKEKPDAASPPQTGERTGPQRRRDLSIHAGSVSKIGFGSIPGMDRERPSAGTFATYRKMKCNPTIALARLIATAPIRAAEWSVEADDEAPQERKKFIQKQLSGVWDLLINDMMLALDYGFSPFELVWALSELADGTSIVLERCKPLLVDLSNPLIVADTGAFDGIENGHGKDKIELPAEYSLWYAYDQEAGNLYGRSRHENIRDTAWRDWCDVAKKCAKYIKRVSGAVPMIEYPDGESTDKSGATRSHWDIAQQLVRELSDCNAICMPNVLAGYAEDFARAGGSADKLRAWNIGFLESKDSHGGEFLELMHHKESLMLRGWLVPERAAVEATTAGSRADSQSHGDLVATMADLVLNDCIGVINKQIVDRLMLWNFGEESVGTIRLARAKIDSEVQMFIRELTKMILGSPSNMSLLMKIVDLNQLLDTAGLPKREEQIDQDALEEEREAKAAEIAGQMQPGKGPLPPFGKKPEEKKPEEKEETPKEVAASMVDSVMEVYSRAKKALPKKGK